MTVEKMISTVLLKMIMVSKEQRCQQKLCYDNGDFVGVDEDDDVDDNVDVVDVEDEDDDDGMRITLQSVDLLVKP